MARKGGSASGMNMSSACRQKETHIVRQILELRRQLCDEAGQLVVAHVVIPVLYMVPSQHLDLAHIILSLPLEKVDLFQELLLVMLQLPHRETSPPLAFWLRRWCSLRETTRADRRFQTRYFSNRSERTI